jgi:hypothetical protein
MGQELAVSAHAPLAEVLATLGAAGAPCHVLMVDGQLVPPTSPPPRTWTEVRLRTPAGMITLRQRGPQVVLLVFGNAEVALLALRDRMAAAFAGRAPFGRALLRNAMSVCVPPKLFTSTNESNTPMRSLLREQGFEASGVIHNLDEGDPELVFFQQVRE